VSRVVLFPQAPGGGLAHLGACLSVGRRLRERGHEVICAYGGTAPELVERDGFPIEPVPEVSLEQSLRGLDHWFTGADQLLALTEADEDVLERTRADAAVIDMRIASSLAAERMGVPAVAVMHFLRYTGYWREPAPWRKRLRQAGRLHRAPRSLGERRRDRAAGAVLLGLWAEARGRLGLPPRDVVEGDAVAVTSTPLLDPSAGLPPHWEYTGPIAWSAGSTSAPVERGSRPLVYVTQGSTGSAELLRRATRELAGEDVDLVVTTAGLCDPEELRRLAPAARVERLLPSSACLEAADVAVVHGGHLTSSEAHRLATPVVVLPAGNDHWAWAERVERLGTGVALRPPVATGAVRRAVRRVLGHERYGARARHVAAHHAEWDGAARSADLVEGLLA
jgi:UDP:flavonoid glycosyltransferase YjiC (YdhE family)